MLWRYGLQYAASWPWMAVVMLFLWSSVIALVIYAIRAFSEPRGEPGGHGRAG